MKSHVFDLIAIIGGLVACAGVYLQYGLGPALIAGGTGIVALAVNGARIHGGGHVSDAG